MTADARKTEHVSRWVFDLAAMTKGGRSPPDAHVLSLFTNGLAEAFPIDAFTADSLHHAIFRQEFFPSFNHVRHELRLWWEDHRPPGTPDVAARIGARMTPMDHAWQRFFYRRRAEIAGANIQDPRGEDRDPAVRIQSPIGNLESLIRTKSPAAWSTISGETDEMPEATEAERAAIARAVAGLSRRRAA